jgi:hypothetical protein
LANLRKYNEASAMALKKFSHPKDTSEKTASSDTTLQVLNFTARFVNVERSDDDKTWLRSEVTNGNGDMFYDIFTHSVNVELELGRDWDNRSTFSNCACGKKKKGHSQNLHTQKRKHTLDKSKNLLVLFFRLTFFHQINFVLHDENVFQFHDFNGS